MIQRFLNGFKLPFVGKNSLFKIPGVKRWLVIPFLIQMTLFGLGIYFGVGEIKNLTKNLLAYFHFSEASYFGNPLYILAVVVFSIIFGLIYFYFIYIFAAIISSPFYSIMSEKVLIHHKVAPQHEKFRSIIAVSVRMIKVSILKGLLFGVLGLFIFIGSFLPGINLISAFVAALVISYDISDYALEVMEFNLRQRLKFFREHLPEYIGLAGFVSLTALLPGLILIVMPIAVLGSAEFVANSLKSRERS